MNNAGKISGYNMVAIVVYSIIIRIIAGNDGHNNSSLGIAGLSAVAVSLHVLLCLALSLYNYTSVDKALGKAWLLSAGIVLLVGYSVCLGNAML